MVINIWAFTLSFSLYTLLVHLFLFTKSFKERSKGFKNLLIGLPYLIRIYGNDTI